MSLALERPLTPQLADTPDSQREVSVIFTSIKPTLAALRTAAILAGRIRGRISLVVPQVVGFPAPLTSPPVLLDFSERHFRTLADVTSVETIVRIYLCRDRLEMLRERLEPRSLVVIGLRRKWWPTDETRLAAKLRHEGHHVVLVDAE